GKEVRDEQTPPGAQPGERVGAGQPPAEGHQWRPEPGERAQGNRHPTILRDRRTVDAMGTLYWWSIEVFDSARGSADRWKDAYGNALTEAAITHGAYEWEWHRHPWGVLFEIAFRSEERFESFRNLPGVRATLDAVPDP